MHLEQAKSAISAASVALLVLLCSGAAFLPQFNERVLNSVPLVVALGVAIACSLILHLVFVGIAAKKLSRSPVRWAAIALFTLPVGSIVGIVLFEWRIRGAAAHALRGAA